MGLRVLSFYLGLCFFVEIVEIAPKKEDQNWLLFFSFPVAVGTGFPY